KPFRAHSHEMRCLPAARDSPLVPKLPLGNLLHGNSARGAAKQEFGRRSGSQTGVWEPGVALGSRAKARARFVPVPLPVPTAWFPSSCLGTKEWGWRAKWYRQLLIPVPFRLVRPFHFHANIAGLLGRQRRELGAELFEMEPGD